MHKSFMQPGPMGVENQGIIVSMLHSAFLHTVSIAWLPQGIKVSIPFGKPCNTTTALRCLIFLKLCVPGMMGLHARNTKFQKDWTPWCRVMLEIYEQASDIYAGGCEWMEGVEKKITSNVLFDKEKNGCLHYSCVQFNIIIVITINQSIKLSLF